MTLYCCLFSVDIESVMMIVDATRVPGASSDVEKLYTLDSDKRAIAEKDHADWLKAKEPEVCGKRRFYCTGACACLIVSPCVSWC